MTQAANSVITDEMRAAMGVEGPRRRWKSRRRTAHVRPLRRAQRRDLLREAAAKARGYRGIVAPPGSWERPFSGLAGWRTAGEMGGRCFSIPYKRVLNGGTDYEYFPDEDVVCAGDTITARARSPDLRRPKGSLGPMLITKRETTYTNQNGKVVAKMYGTTIQY